jgi:hypothetical protein
MTESNNGNTTIEEKSVSDGGGEGGKKSWLEQQIEKIVGGQKDM